MSKEKMPNIWVPKYSKEEGIVIINQFDDDLIPVEIPLPDPPNDRDIINYGQTTTNQIFRRTPYNERLAAIQKRVRKTCKENKRLKYREELHKELYSNQRQYKDIFEWINREWDRRLNGAWYFIGGQRTYFPGSFGMFLNYWTLPEGMPVYRDSDRKKYIFREHAFKDPYSYGTVEITKRRDGKSEQAMSMMFEQASRTKFFVGGIQSKTDEDASKLFQKMVRGWWGKMPFFFSPIHSHNKKPTSSVKFELSKVMDGEEDISLQSETDYRSSKVLAYDGYHMDFYVDDELFKLENIDCYERWGVVKPTLINPFGEITGKSMHTSTVEEIGKHGFAHAKRMWNDSCYHDRDPVTGQTKSGLWRMFTPAYEGQIIDRYGRTMYEESKEHLLRLREQKRNSNDRKAYYQEVRKFPFFVKEAFIVSSENCQFDVDIIVGRLEDFFKGNPFIIRGDFLWENGKADGNVIFKQNDTNGRFFVSHLPDEGIRNAQERKGTMIKPGNKLQYIAGGDTFKYNKTEGTSPSLGGGAILRRYNPLLDGNVDHMPKGMTWEEEQRYILANVSRRCVCTYNYRPPSKNEYVEDMIKMCKFYGAGMFPEVNVPTIHERFEERGYGGYLIYKYDKKRARQALNPGESSTNPVKDELFSVTNDYILEAGEHEVHEELMEQWLKVDFDSMTDYDLFTAFAYALYGDKLTYRQVERERERADRLAKLKASKKKSWHSPYTIDTQWQK